MKPQEFWSQTYNHLWSGANTMLANTPTISRHLARMLLSSVPEDGMSALANRLHCQKCSALMTAAKVRTRKVRKRPRRAQKAVKNFVLRTCSMCGTSNADKGTQRVAMSKAIEEEIEELRTTMEKQRRKADAREARVKDTGREVVDGRIKKKKKKKKTKGGSQNNSNSEGSVPRTGLAASFLFDPVT